MKNLIIFLTAIVVLSGCNTTKRTKEDPSDKKIGSEYVLNDTWELTQIGDKPADKSNFKNGLPYMTIMVDAMAVNGNTGCNSMSGMVMATYETIKFSNIVQTEMYCEGVDEKRFIDALLNADSWTYENERLFLYSGKVVAAVFKKK